MPFDKDQIDNAGKTAWDSAYDLENASVLWSEPPVPYIERFVIPFFLDNQAQRILDLPCGDGRNTIPLAKTFPRVVGADSSENALRIISQRLKAERISDITLQHEDIFSTSWPDEQFDGILCWDLIGHLARPRNALLELLRILLPHGHLIFSVFAMEDSTRGKEMEPIGPNEFRYLDKFYFKYYNATDAQVLASGLPVRSERLDFARWHEPPHEGYREYVHEHASHVIILEK